MATKQTNEFTSFDGKNQLILSWKGRTPVLRSAEPTSWFCSFTLIKGSSSKQSKQLMSDLKWYLNLLNV